ncbi:hypothetical protein GCM10009804_17080 [Kribbella hippodromi]|uniref:Abhydrolase family protein n=1 Tax=Kribbella hippodromi TaxID=434347 RepID=A0ABN2CM17_9ACTN
MKPRNTSPYDLFLTQAQNHHPKLSFPGGTSGGGAAAADGQSARGTAGDFADWREQTTAAVLATLGQLPAPVDPNPQLIAELDHGRVVEQRWLIDVEAGLSAYATVLRPADLAPGERRPGILCWHGHDGQGKDTIMRPDPTTEPTAGATGAGSMTAAAGATSGVTAAGAGSGVTAAGTGSGVTAAGAGSGVTAAGARSGVTDAGYGWRMAEGGFVTFAIDWMGRGDLDDDRKPNHRSVADGRDWCNLYYLHATMLGRTPLGMNLAHGRVLTDFVANLPFVDADRLGVMGASGGGTLALWSALADVRLRAIEIICYSDLFAVFGYRDINYCGLQIAPGLYDLVDVPDLQGLLAPRPLLVDIGLYDECFRAESALACHHRVREIYTAAGAEDHLLLDLNPTAHGWQLGQSHEFFTNHLQPQSPARPQAQERVR